MARRRNKDFDDKPPFRPCDHDGCDKAGEFRAPKDRSNLREYYWFCLEHVREYNKSWNYFNGMSRDEIESHQAGIATWGRPTWDGKGRRTSGAEVWRDDLGIFSGVGIDLENDMAGQSTTARFTREERQAITTLQIEGDVTLDSVKKQYKLLVKAHHPDINQRDPMAEDRLKDINQAYTVLIARLENRTRTAV